MQERTFFFLDFNWAGHDVVRTFHVQHGGIVQRTAVTRKRLCALLWTMIMETYSIRISSNSNGLSPENKSFCTLWSNSMCWCRMGVGYI